jgi:hypothetical protein
MPFDSNFVIKSLESAEKELDKLETNEIVRSLKTTILALQSTINHEARLEDESSDAIEVMVKDAVKDSVNPRWSLKNTIVVLGSMSFYSVVLWRLFVMGINMENEGKYIETKGNMGIIEAARLYKFSDREKFLEGLKDIRTLKTKTDLIDDQIKADKSTNQLLHSEIWNAIRGQKSE